MLQTRDERSQRLDSPLSGFAADGGHRCGMELACLLLGLVWGCAGPSAEETSSESTEPPSPEVLQRQCQREQFSSCTKLAQMHAKGQGGLEENHDRAVELYERACQEGDQMKACGRLGSLYVTNEHGRQDLTRGLDRLERACKGGWAKACMNLGVVYLRGRGVPQNVERGQKWLEKGCDRGDALGCAILGALYLNGRGVTRDTRRGKKLLEKGCRGGSKRACKALKYVK